MNETLVGGDRVLSASALDQWTDCFRQARDRDYWQRLGMRLLK